MSPSLSCNYIINGTAFFNYIFHPFPCWCHKQSIIFSIIFMYCTFHHFPWIFGQILMVTPNRYLYQLWDTFLGVVRVIPDSAPPRSGKPAVTWGVLGQDFDGFWSDISKVGPETSYIQIGFCNFSIKDYCIYPSETYFKAIYRGCGVWLHL